MQNRERKRKPQPDHRAGIYYWSKDASSVFQLWIMILSAKRIIFSTDFQRVFFVSLSLSRSSRRFGAFLISTHCTRRPRPLTNSDPVPRSLSTPLKLEPWKLLLICNTLRVPNRYVIFISCRTQEIYSAKIAAWWDVFRIYFFAVFLTLH